MPLKKKAAIKSLTASGAIDEEIFAYFGKILFPAGDMKIANAFSAKHRSVRARLLKANYSASTLISTDLPGVPKFLRSLPPVDEIERGMDHANGKLYTRRYRLRYLPVISRLGYDSDAPPIEIDVLKHGEDGSAVKSHVTNAWAILDQQSHKILTPAFALDLIFVRRLRRQLCNVGAKMDRRSDQVKLIKQLEEQIQTLDSDRFPPFIKVDIPALQEDKCVSTKPAPHRAQPKSNASEGTLSPIQPSTGPVIAGTQKRTKSSLQSLDYMLESWELVHSTSYKIKQVSLEHLSFEGATADEDRELLRLGPRQLHEGIINQVHVPLLLEHAFKIAAHLSDSRLLDQPEHSAFHATKTHTAKVHLQKSPSLCS